VKWRPELSSFVGLILIFHIIAGVGSAQESDSSVVGTASALEFHSDFWMNLHHVLHAAARGARIQNISVFDLPPGEQKIWDSAVEVYTRGYAQKDLLFDRDMERIKTALGRSNRNLNAARIPEDLRKALEQAAPIYREHVWAAADAANRAWIAEEIRNINQLAPVETPKLASLFGTPWPKVNVRVDAVRVANRQGAYTSLEPPWIVVSTGDPNSQSWAGAEILFHESSHLLVRPVSSAIDKAAREASVKAPDVLWHVVLFYIAGEVTRQSLLSEGVVYEPYVYKTGLFDRAWPTLRKPIEMVLPAYLGGSISLDEAARRLISELKN
jgi:hypothetical protein